MAECPVKRETVPDAWRPTQPSDQPVKPYMVGLRDLAAAISAARQTSIRLLV